MAAARRWIAGASARAAAGHALDLVIDQDGVCVGEVGVAHLDRRRRAALMGWWVAAGHRGQGLATTAVRTLADWLLGPGGLTAVVAEIDHGNHPSQRTALHAGFVTLRSGGADHPTVLVRRQENN